MKNHWQIFVGCLEWNLDTYIHGMNFCLLDLLKCLLFLFHLPHVSYVFPPYLIVVLQLFLPLLWLSAPLVISVSHAVCSHLFTVLPFPSCLSSVLACSSTSFPYASYIVFLSWTSVLFEPALWDLCFLGLYVSLMSFAWKLAFCLGFPSCVSAIGSSFEHTHNS